MILSIRDIPNHVDEASPMMIGLEEERCRACSIGRLAKKVAIPDFEYATQGSASYGECLGCGSFTQIPMPDGNRLAAAYPSDYHSFLPASRLSRLRQRMRISQLKLAFGRGQLDRRILDFGCGDGIFLNALAEAFPKGQFFGYEIGDSNIKEERFEGRVRIYRGDPQFFWGEIPKMDLVTMNHVIEHLPEPLQTLQQINAILAPGGLLEGQTPNSDCIERSIFKTRWSGFHSPRHTVVFSRRGLEKVLLDAGFVSPEVRSGFNPASWAVSFGSMLQNSDKPSGIRRKGIRWLALVLAAGGPSWIESRFYRSGIINFEAGKPM
jgi:SAM-dependent methyltransferase